MPPALALVALAYATGIALRETLSLPLTLCAALVLVTAASLAATLFSARLAQRRFGLAALALALALGTLAAALAWPLPVAALAAPEHQKPWRVRAHLVAEPERAFGDTHLLLDLDELHRDGVVPEARDASGFLGNGHLRLALHGDPAEPLAPGDAVYFRARLTSARGFYEPDSPDPARRQAERGAVAVAGVAEPQALARLVGNGAARPGLVGLLARVSRLRQALLRRVAAVLPGDLLRDRRALVGSLVLGERAEVSRELSDAFRRAGVVHVLSVSGLHLALAAFLFFVGLRRLLVRVTPLSRRWEARRIAALCALPATLGYTLLTGAEVATVRSCAATWVVLIGVALGRPATLANAFAAAALLLLVASPLALYDPSFQLSFAAALATARLAPPLTRLATPARLVGHGWPRRLLRGALSLTCVSLAATAATAPISAWHFAQVAPAGLVANLVVVPLAELWVLPAGLLGCACAFLGPLGAYLADWIFRFAGLGAAAMGAATRFFAGHTPAGYVPAPTLVEAALYYAALVTIVVWLRAAAPRTRRMALLAAALAASGFSLSLAWRFWLGPRLRPALTLTFLDVGQGDACFVRLPDGRGLLIDGGGAWNDRFDPGEQLLVPWLRRQGVSRIDYVVLTHPHPDHAAGLGAVVADLDVGEVWTNGVPSSLPALLRLQEAAHHRGVPIVRPHALAGPAPLTVLSPLDGDGHVSVPPGWSENDGSIVLRLDYAGRRALLTGDIEHAAESALVARDPAALRADVLKAPHHGSRTSSSPDFLAAVRPALVVYSVGAGNQWGFPAPEVTERARRLGARLYRIDRDGAVTVRIDPRGGGLTARTAR